MYCGCQLVPDWLYQWLLKNGALILDIKNYLENAINLGASDLFIVVGRPISIRKTGQIIDMDNELISPAISEELIWQIYDYAGRSFEHFKNYGDDDFSFAIPGISRFRVNCFKQRGTLSAVVRIISFSIPSYEELQIPPYVIELANTNKGMVLVTGPAGSGRSTTLACMVDFINKRSSKHIITLEEPLEFLHKHDKSIVNQREINVDTDSYATALRAALRQSPDVILLGEICDCETVGLSITAAQMGHLLLSSLDTLGAANAVAHIINAFPDGEQNQIAVQLSMVLNAVVYQQLVPTIDGGQTLAVEVMTVTPAIRNMIRNNKINQIKDTIYMSSADNMISMDKSLLALFRKGRISKDTAIRCSVNPEHLEQLLA